MKTQTKLTFAEKIFGAPAGAIVFAKPDLVLSHDNTASIAKTFQKMGGNKVLRPEQLVVVLDHNAPPADAKLASQYQEIRDFADIQNVSKFHDAGNGICHQLMADYARPGMLIVGSDSHTSTAGAFNALAAGIDRTETAGIWKKGETWFRVPQSVKIIIRGKLRKGVYAKDLALWIIGMSGADGANYMSVEYHGDGVGSLRISDRMVLANLASEMGAKNAVFPPDKVLCDYYGEAVRGVWADDGADYASEWEIKLDDIFPVVAVPHQVDNVVSVADIKDTIVHEGLIGTCTNGRIEDLRIAADILRGKKIARNFQLSVIPASRKIFLQAIEEGLISALIEAGANILTPSCGPCLGTGQGIPADGHNVISTANRNFAGRMGNTKAAIFLASPATVAISAMNGRISDPRPESGNEKYRYRISTGAVIKINAGEARKVNSVWNYSDLDNLNTDLMFAGKHTYNILSTDPDGIMQHLFEDFDPEFRKLVQNGDIIIAGENFGCGSSREHPSVGLAHAGIKAVIAKSVNRIFFRSSINQGLLLIVCPEAVDAYKTGDKVKVDTEKGIILIGSSSFSFEPLPEKLKQIIDNKGLINYLKNN
jgi:3-isopropylmalate dehydratase large subunit/3-isopropylmalate dehydratase small subunit